MFLKELNISNKFIKSLVGGQLISSLLAVSTITVSFTSNLLMVQDRVNEIVKDIDISPISNSKKALAYFISSFISSILVNFTALILCLLYVRSISWYYNFNDIFLLVIDVILLTLFGSILASCINFNLKSQGKISSVGSIVSAGYGFICGAYMSISSFSNKIRNVISYLPSTYITSLTKAHAINPIIKNSNKILPKSAIVSLKDSIDCNLYFNNELVLSNQKYLIIIVTIIILIFIYILFKGFF